MKLRSHLLVLTLAVLLPVSVFGVATTLWVADRERAAFERGAIERTQALLTAVDTELGGHLTSLQGLATSYPLQNGDLEAFRRQAERLLPMHANWHAIALLRPSGEPVLTVTRGDSAGRRPAIASAEVERTLSERTPGVSNLSVNGGRRTFSVTVPVDVAGELSVLGAVVDARSILDLLTPQPLQRDWVAAVLDRGGNVVARTSGGETFPGETITRDLRQALQSSGEGWINHRAEDGEETYTPYSRSARSGWTVAMAIPAADVEAITDHTMLLLAVWLLFALMIAVMLAAGFSRRIAEPIVELAEAAKALGRGTRVAPPAGAPVREVRDVSRALIASAHAVGEREDKLRAADRAKDEFLAMLGHELRNPLGALTSATQVLNAGRRASKASSEAVTIISRQVEHMTRIVDDLLDVGRASSGKIRLKLAPLDLGHAIAEAARTLERTSKFEDLDVQVDTSPVWIRGDGARIEQIAANLLENAAKYTPAGGTIRVSVRRDGLDAVFEVVDDGIGIAAELLPRVFDLFVQGQTSMDRSVGGLGIGLTLVKRLAELHLGTVIAESGGADKGARFLLRFPAIEAPAPAAGSPHGAVKAHELRKVLLVEDNEDARHALLTMLRHHGFRTFAAADGLEGISVAAEVQPDAAVIDIGLPQYDGFEVARQLRAGLGGEQMLLVALTGYGSREVRRKATDAGFDEFLVKPVSPTDLADLIQSRLEPVVLTG
ncbi:MAG TPA: ATP-binding protein [Woeseiaceae bacterium]|nr:ATP-binding protein [Woeseiaceae bacterium]